MQIEQKERKLGQIEQIEVEDCGGIFSFYICNKIAGYKRSWKKAEENDIFAMSLAGG